MQEQYRVQDAQQDQQNEITISYKENYIKTKKWINKNIITRACQQCQVPHKSAHKLN